VKSRQEVVSVLLKALMRGIIELLSVAGKGRANIAPVRTLREVDREVDVPVFPDVVDVIGLVLRLDGLDLEAIGVRAVGRDEVHGMSRIQEWSEDLPTVLHQPRGNEELIGMVLVEACMGVVELGGADGHNMKRLPAEVLGINHFWNMV
jgi:hypothetical protein